MMVAAVGAAMAANVLAGLAISRLRPGPAARLAAWTLVVVAVAAADRLTAREPPGVRMIAIIVMLLHAMKVVVTVEGDERLTPGRWLAFTLLWPGMRPGPFRSTAARPLPGARALFWRGAVTVVVGFALVGLARVVFLATGSRLLATPILLTGLSLILHFGLFTIASGVWRALGVNVGRLFRAPLRSRSLREFWGRRWNLAFSEMTSAAIFRPLAPRVGAPTALVISFLASGVFHELAISVPVRAGYGRPLLYFALHGGLVLAERTSVLSPRALPRWAGRAWTAAWLIAPLPLLFHRPFLNGVLWPIIGAASLR
ncbi:MAG TPA: MBOAT family protein [Vicinamibacteria bacterium]